MPQFDYQKHNQYADNFFNTPALWVIIHLVQTAFPIKICDSTYMLNAVCNSLWNLTIHQIQHQCEIWMPDHPNNPACIKCASLHNVKVGRHGTAKCQEVHFTWKHKIKCFYPMCHTVSLVLCHTGTRMQCRVWQNQVPSTFKEAEIQLTRCHYCFTSQNKGYTN